MIEYRTVSLADRVYDQLEYNIQWNCSRGRYGKRCEGFV